ncbi:hypothetical protein HDU98_003436 [Podochytrium sp. JEL0797]|nr:hypothetical protein HDU98_003436 [Podochytrium sp. JEL0797]
MRTLFFGSDEFSVVCCTRLVKSLETGVLSSLEIVTPPDSRNTKQREVPLKTFALKNNIKLHTAPPKSLKGWKVPSQFDLGVVVSFGYFLPSDVIRSFPKAALNVHPSLLPRYRGAAPIQHTILNGDTETGVSIMELHEEQFDAGRIFHQSKMTVGVYPFYKVLHDRLAARGAEDLAETIANFDQFKSKAWLQDLSQVTHARKISKSLAAIDFESMTRERVYALHRAIGYKIPLHVDFRAKRVQLLSLFLPTPPQTILLDPLLPPGSIAFNAPSDALFVMCSDGWIGVSALKVQGKKEVTANAFRNGYRLQRGDVFGVSVVD